MKPNTDLLYATLDNVIAANTRGAWAQDTWCNVEEPWPECLCHVAGYDNCQPDCQAWKERTEARIAATGEECGTTACFAGWALITAGGQFQGGEIVLDGEPVEDIAAKAQRRLRLTNQERALLFDSAKSLDGLKHTVDAIVAGDLDGDPDA